jgi:hypothetical protein
LKKTVSIKSSSTSSARTPVHEPPPKVIIRPVIPQPIPPEKIQRSKEEEAEEAAELQQEIDQLLTSLNLEKPLSPPPPTTTSAQLISTDEPNQIGHAARTLYDYEKTQVIINEKKETPNLIDRLLTSRSVQIPKYSSFNPFPSRSFNENVAVNGYKLGLYAPDSTNR